MEKEEALKNLYDLRTGLLMLGMQCERINKKAEFEQMWKNPHRNKNYYDCDDPLLTDLYVVSAPLAIGYEPRPRAQYSTRGWNNWAFDHMVGMYDLNPNWSPFVSVFNYFDNMYSTNQNWLWMTDKEFNEAKKAYFNGYYDDDRLSTVNMMYLFRHNISVMKYLLKVCQDAQTNNKSPYYFNGEKNPGKLCGIFERSKLKKQLPDRIDYYEKVIAVMEKDKKECIKKIKEKYYISSVRTKEELNKDKQVLKEVQEACDMLADHFSFLSRSDWPEIDSIIFMLESGRADTLKEALNLSDLKKYKNEIVESVDRVNRTVIRGINAVRNDLNRYFNTLFDKLDSLNSSLVNIAGEISNNTEAIRCSSAEICGTITKALS